MTIRDWVIRKLQRNGDIHCKCPCGQSWVHVIAKGNGAATVECDVCLNQTQLGTIIGVKL